MRRKSKISTSCMNVLPINEYEKHCIGYKLTDYCNFPHYRFHLITADQDDNKFVDCAIAANAEYIVTEDHHFNELKNISFPSVAIINLKDFAKTL